MLLVAGLLSLRVGSKFHKVRESAAHRKTELQLGNCVGIGL